MCWIQRSYRVNFIELIILHNDFIALRFAHNLILFHFQRMNVNFGGTLLPNLSIKSLDVLVAWLKVDFKKFRRWSTATSGPCCIRIVVVELEIKYSYSVSYKLVYWIQFINFKTQQKISLRNKKRNTKACGCMDQSCKAF